MRTRSLNLKENKGLAGVYKWTNKLKKIIFILEVLSNYKIVLLDTLINLISKVIIILYLGLYFKYGYGNFSL